MNLLRSIRNEIELKVDEHIIPMSYLEYEEGNKNNKPILICVHGLTRNAHDFDFIASELSSKYKVYSLDIPGRGRSKFIKDYNLYNYDTYSKLCLDYIYKMGLKDITWLGTSMGGLIGMFLNSIDSNLIVKFIFNDIGPQLPIDALQRIGKYVGILPIFNSLDDLEKHLKKILAPFGIEEMDHWRYLTLHGYRVLENGKYTLAYDENISKSKSFQDVFQLERDVELWEAWNKISQPTLVLKGQTSDILTHPIYNKMLEKSNVYGIEIKGIGHAPALMNSAQINMILNWLF